MATKKTAKKTSPKKALVKRTEKSIASSRRFTDIIFEVKDQIAWITINRPERGNGMSDPMIIELGDLVEKEGDKVRLIVLRGAGKDFCVGRASMGAPRPAGLDAYQTRAISDHVFRCYGLFRKCNAPIMAVVQGQAAGFGFAPMIASRAPGFPGVTASRQTRGTST